MNDIKKILQHLRENTVGKKIKISYTVESAVDILEGKGPVDRGWVNEEGILVENVQEAVKILSESNVFATSESFQPGVWYRAETDRDTNNATITYHHFFLEGFEYDDEQKIYEVLTA